MKLQALQAVRPKAKPATGVLAQRKGGGATLAAPMLEAARPLDTGVRQRMEAGFGHDFGAVRIHDHAGAHAAARAAGAQAYAAGNDIVFAAGRYQPETAAGSALLAHELAHTVQQAGVLAKTEGPLPASADHALEAEADRAAAAVLAGERAPPLSRLAAPALQRTPDPAASTSSQTPAGGPSVGLPPGMELIDEEPKGPGATVVKVRVPNFVLPQPKGAGTWVTQAYKTAGDGGRLVFNPLLEGGRVAAFKEGAENYQSVWANNLGFESLKALGAAIGASTHPDVKKAMQDPGVAKAIAGMTGGGLKGSHFDIDHIVEKQIGGTSIPSNLQLLVSEKNQASGRETYRKMVGLVEELRKPAYRPKARQIQLSFPAITVPAGDASDPCYLIESFLRAGAVKGSDALMTAAKGSPVLLTAGGQGETVRVTDAPTDIDGGARRVVPGMRLTTYTRHKAGPRGKPAIDKVAAELDSRAISKTGSTAPITLSAAKGEAPPGLSASVGGKAAAENEAALSAAGETRVLKFDPKPKTIGFFYPYLSPGELTKFDIGAGGAFSGEGVIHPTLKFLPDVHIRYAPDLLEVVAPLDAKTFKSPIPMIRFTSGELKLALAPKFLPSGELSFEIGPGGKPLMLGTVSASAPGGVFTAAGTLKPGGALPGISDARGEVTYNADAGWSGKLTASTSKLPNTTVNVVLSFAETGGKFVTKAEGGLVTKIGDKTLALNAGWTAAGLVYTGGLDWPKPFPIVDNVTLRGRYAAGLLYLEGATKFRFKQWDGDITVNYSQRDGQPGKLSGKGKVKVETKNKKAAGALEVEVSDTGQLTGQGDVTYQLTDKIAPKLGVKLAKGGHLTISGEVKVGNIDVFRKWPEKRGEKTLMSLKPSFKIPTPIPAVNAAINIDAGVGVYYSVGPGMITGVVIKGEFDPLEENPSITASLVGKFVIPTGFGLTGHVAAKIGVEVAGGAVGVDGGVQVRPSIGVSADATVDVAAKYDKGGFDFVGKAYIDVVPKATLDVDLVASMYAGWHLLEYGWSYKVGSLAYTFPQNIRINIGEIGYSTVAGMRWPKLSDISMEPADISPLKMIQDIMEKRKTTEKPGGG